MSNSKSSKKQTSIKTIIWISAIVVFSLWALNFFLLKLGSDERGVFGDMFGAVNSLFSGLAFSGIIITIYLQRNELTLQRKELELTREEFKTQNTTLRLQRFENTFFSMLSLHHEIVKGIDWIKEEFVPYSNVENPDPEIGEYVKNRYTGRDVFHINYHDLWLRLRHNETQADVSATYIAEYRKYQNDFDNYFRNLGQIISFIDNTQLTENDNPEYELREKIRYADILKAQLSTFELLWIFYNGLSSNGIKFKPLIEKYGFFNDDFILDDLAEDYHTDFYDGSAFERQE